MEHPARESFTAGPFQYRRLSHAPQRPALTPVSVVKPAQPSSTRTSASQHSGPPQPGKTNRKKTSSSSRLRIDPTLPEHQRLVLLLENGSPLEFGKLPYASATERHEADQAVQAILDFARAHPVEPKQQPDPMNTKLAQREAQLAAVIAAYERELEEWEQVLDEAPSAPMSVGDLPERSEEGERVEGVEDVLARSTSAVEEYVLQTDHLRRTLKRLESRNRVTDRRVKEIAATLNERVMAELGVEGEENLRMPSVIGAARTKEV